MSLNFPATGAFSTWGGKKSFWDILKSYLNPNNLKISMIFCNLNQILPSSKLTWRSLRYNMNTGILRLTKYTKDFCQQTEEHWQSNWKSEHSHPQNEKTNHIAESKQSTHCKESKPVNTIAEKKKSGRWCAFPPQKNASVSQLSFSP